MCKDRRQPCFKIHRSSGCLSNWAFYGYEICLKILDMQDSGHLNSYPMLGNRLILFAWLLNIYSNYMKLGFLVRYELLYLHFNQSYGPHN